MSTWHNFQDWRDIKGWLEDNGFKLLPKRMQLNNDCWMSSGEFGRSQVMICDTLRTAHSEEDALELAEAMEADLQRDEVLQLAIGAV